MKLVMSIIVCLILTSCGYTFQGSGSVLPPDVKRIAIPIVENSSTEAGLAVTMTEALRDRFERFGVVTIVEDVKDADAVLKARILKVVKDTRTTTSNTDTQLQLNSTLTLAGELRRIDGSLLWRNNGISVTKAYGTTKSVVVTSSAQFSAGNLSASDLGGLDDLQLGKGQEAIAIGQAIDDVASKVYDEAIAPDF
jgi:outer membrane lipopolysaccharide assembly protein LptE/RlpB